MADLRSVLAALLGFGHGLLLLVYPSAVIRLQPTGRLPHDRRGEYGEATPASDRWRLVGRAIGVVLVVAGLYFTVGVVQSVGLF